MTTLFSRLTAVLLALIALTVVLMFQGVIPTNFALMLFVLTVVTGAYWLGERLYFRPAREREAAELEARLQSRRNELGRMGIDKVDGDLAQVRQQALTQPWWLDWTAGLFPVILAVFLLRSFLFEPFKIPSGSMVPTLLVGDLILVSKYHYGIRLPVINKKIIDNHSPQRGDVMVFRYPRDISIDYIKRVVGVPGDEVSFHNQQLTINGQPVPMTALGEYYDEDGRRYSPMFSEKLGEVEHRILVDPKRQSFVPGADDFPYRDHCRYSAEGVTCKVPEGHYFMMGDNRDNSQDSRYWGFVPEANIVGRAFFIWMNFSNFGRFGSFD